LGDKKKGPDRAIEIAKRVDMPLKMAAKVDRVDRRYFKQVVEPLLNDPHVEWVGEINDKQKKEFLGNAYRIAVSHRLAGAFWAGDD
jgi:hypothetical protein